MTHEEFTEKYCNNCGTQRCAGINDEDFREGCLDYRREFYGEKENLYETYINPDLPKTKEIIKKLREKYLRSTNSSSFNQ